MIPTPKNDPDTYRQTAEMAKRFADEAVRPIAACSMAKLYAGDMAVAQTANAVQVFGGAGHIRGFEVERLYRDAKITQICEETQQIQRAVIARELIRNGARP